jgi:hypothetical protein
MAVSCNGLSDSLYSGFAQESNQQIKASWHRSLAAKSKKFGFFIMSSDAKLMTP